MKPCADWVSTSSARTAAFPWSTIEASLFARGQIASIPAGAQLLAHKYGWYGMVSCMKTTIELSDDLLLRAKELAQSERRTLRSVVEEALRALLQSRRNRSTKFKLRDASFGKGGLRSDVDAGDWSALMKIIYDGRGG